LFWGILSNSTENISIALTSELDGLHEDSHKKILKADAFFDSELNIETKDFAKDDIVEVKSIQTSCFFLSDGTKGDPFYYEQYVILMHIRDRFYIDR
jgi:hypothetical protein